MSAWSNKREAKMQQKQNEADAKDEKENKYIQTRGTALAHVGEHNLNCHVQIIEVEGVHFIGALVLAIC